MSTNQNKINRDSFFMSLALNQAMINLGNTKENPSVGCVITKNNSVVSAGYTSFNGRPHAETIALNKNRKKNIGSTLYLTLEPCSHYGKTPPCTKAIINSKVKKVIYSIQDKDLRSFNKSKKILKMNKILTKSGLLSKEVTNFYKSYNYIKKNQTPYITGKIASSANLFILNNNTRITNEYSKKVSHLLRYENQGILTTYKTINRDNPKLTCRINGLEKFSPVRLIIDKDLKINLSSYIVKKSAKPKTVIFHNSKNTKKINKLKRKGVKLIFFKTGHDNYFDLIKLCKKIYKIGIHTILVECGRVMTNKMLSKRLLNEFYLFKSNKTLNNKDKINIFDINRNLNKKFRNKDFVNTYLDKDILIHYY